MAPGRYDLDIYRGDTYAWQFRLWQDEAQTQPYDLTGSTVAAQIRDSSGGSRVVSLGLVVTLPNIVDATLDADASEQVPVGGWDLQVTNGTQVRTVIAGRVRVQGDITVVAS